MRVDRFSICKPIKGVCKSHGIWAHEGGKMAPLVYLQRPEWIKYEDWERIINSIELSLLSGFVIEEDE